MRRNRIIWFVLWALSLAGISFRGGAVTYGLFFALTLAPIVSLVYLAAVYALFHLYQHLDRRFVTVNEPVDYRFILVNEYPLQFVGIRVRFFTSFSSITDLDDETEYELRPGTRIEKETRLICRYRGEYRIGIKEIEIQDFFRLFRIRYKNKECIRAVVKPQLIKTDRIGDVVLSDAVKHSLQDRSEMDVTSREYIPGDDMRFVNWSQYARTGILMTREQTGSDYSEIAVITDTYRDSEEQSEYLPRENRILELVLAISYFYCRNNIGAAEYHVSQDMVRLSAENTWKFEEYYNSVSEIMFNSRNTHALLRECVMRRRDICGSAAVFLILSSWDKDISALVGDLERNGMDTVIILVSNDASDLPDLSSFKGCTFLHITPDSDLTKELS